MSGSNDEANRSLSSTLSRRGSSFWCDSYESSDRRTGGPGGSRSTATCDASSDRISNASKVSARSRCRRRRLFGSDTPPNGLPCATLGVAVLRECPDMQYVSPIVKAVSLPDLRRTRPVARSSVTAMLNLVSQLVDKTHAAFLATTVSSNKGRSHRRDFDEWKVGFLVSLRYLLSPQSGRRCGCLIRSCRIQ